MTDSASDPGAAPVMPDYDGGSIVNLMASIGASFEAVSATYAPLRSLPAAALERRNVVLLVIDGLGHHNLLAHCPAGALARHLRGRMTSVFPATTATAVTTFLTGTAPQQHGVTGWITYFRELGTPLAVLPYRPRHGGSAPAVDARSLFGHVPVFDWFEARCHVVAPERILHSEFNRVHNGSAQLHAFTSLSQLFKAITAIVRAGAERQYVYAYWPEFDRLAHEHGAASPEVVGHLAELDAAFERFLARIRGTGTTVIVTADHGFIDAREDRAIELDDHPELAATLLLPLCGERRTVYCYPRVDRQAEFCAYVRTHLAAYADLRRSADLLDAGYFGLGPPHPRLHERIGDYTLLMKDGATLKDWLPGEPRYEHVGVHGGMTAAEMYVPLIVAEE